MPLRREVLLAPARSHGRCVAGLSRACAVAGLVLLVAASAAAQTAQERPPIDGRAGAPGIVRALDAVKADPNLGTQRTIRTLRWKGAAVDDVPNAELPAWLRAFNALTARFTRYLVWLGAIVGALLLAGYIVRLAREDDRDAELGIAATPSHVRDLDIRPESLPRDVGAAARALWEQGEARAALALLYRGTLSRLVHLHGVPIVESSTEGDCLRLCEPRVGAEPRAYVAALLPLWQRLVYGHQAPAGEQVLALCDGFERALAGSTVSVATEPTR